jgi:hypothetical protein
LSVADFAAKLVDLVTEAGGVLEFEFGGLLDERTGADVGYPDLDGPESLCAEAIAMCLDPGGRTGPSRVALMHRRFM